MVVRLLSSVAAKGTDTINGFFLKLYESQT